jgi:DNA-binding transcriptional MerR regulator
VKTEESCDVRRHLVNPTKFAAYRRNRLRIGTLAVLADVSTKTIRYYEAIGLLPLPLRAANGYRRYTETDLTQLQFIRRAQAAGLSLEAIRGILDDHNTGIQPCRQVQSRAEQQIADIDRRIAELQAVRRSLEGLAVRAGIVAYEGTCDADEICSAFGHVAH